MVGKLRKIRNSERNIFYTHTRENFVPKEKTNDRNFTGLIQ